MFRIPENCIIEEITEVGGWDVDFDGLLIKTDRGEIKLQINNYGQCCENFGNLFFETPDDISRFIGSTILKVEQLDIEPFGCSGDECNETQLKITTSVGVLQYAVYNSHNGYYSHATILQVFDTVDHGYL